MRRTRKPTTKMVRTRFTEETAKTEEETTTIINYFDRDRKNRWGVLIREDDRQVIVQDAVGDVTQIPLDKVRRREVRTGEKSEIGIRSIIKGGGSP